MNDNSSAEFKDLKDRVAKLETLKTVALTVITVLGIGGGFLGSELLNLKKLADETKTRYESSRDVVASATNEGVQAIKHQREVEQQALYAQSRDLVRAYLAANVLSGHTSAGAINGHYAEYLDVKIPFTDADGKPHHFDAAPKVIATASRNQAQDDVSWAVTILDVNKDGFSVRVRSVDQHHEGNPGWSGSVGVEWVALNAA